MNYGAHVACSGRNGAQHAEGRAYGASSMIVGDSADNLDNDFSIDHRSLLKACSRHSKFEQPLDSCPVWPW